MTQDSSAQAATSSGARSGVTGPLKIALVVLASIGIGLLLWFLPFGREIVSDSDKRNQRDLAIAASGLETWSDAVKTVAMTNFIRGRVNQLEASDRDDGDGWTHRARFRHPVLGEYKVLYRIGTAADCDAIGARTRQREGVLPFVRNYFVGGSSMLKVLGSFPLSDIWRQDMLIAPAAGGDTGAYLANILNQKTWAYTADPEAKPVTTNTVLMVCYGAVIPLDKLLVIDQAARDFSNLLVVDSGRRIVAQVGAEPIPLKTLDGLVPSTSTSVLVDTLAASTGQKQQVQRQPALVDSLEPVDLDLAGKTMVAYVRPFHPSATGFPACVPGAPDRGFPQIAVSVGGATATTNAVATAPTPPDSADRALPTGQCFVIGLMPKSVVWRKIANPPLALVVGLGLAIGIVLTLLPSLRLLLVGPREAIGRAETIGVALGLPAAASLATLALLFAVDVAANRETARIEAQSIALTAARAGADNIEKSVSRAYAIAGELAATPVAPGDAGHALPDPDYATQCIASSAVDGRGSGYIDIGATIPSNPRPLRCTQAPLCLHHDAARSHLPLVESIGLYGAAGVAIPGSRTIACRSFLGGRSQLLGRNYFQRLISGDNSVNDGVVPVGGSKAPFYVLEQVMSQQDGVSKTIMGFKSPTPAGYAVAGSNGRGVYAIGATVMADLVSPAVLPPFQMMVVDTRDPQLPVIMHPAPNRAGAERLMEMMESPDAVRALLRQTVALGGPDATTHFARFYDGANRQFIAAPIRGSQWVVLVHYADGDIDLTPARTATRTLITWAAMSMIFGLTWVTWLWWVGRRGHPAPLPGTGSVAWSQLTARGWPRLWPQQGHGADYRWLSKRLAIIAGIGLVVLAIAMAAGVWPALIVIVGLAIRAGAGLLLHWKLATPPAASAALSPTTQKRYRQLALALLLCLSMLPMLAFWWDARAFSLAFERQQLLLSLDGVDGVVETADRRLARIWWTFGEPAGKAHPTARDYGFHRGIDAFDPAVRRVAAPSRRAASSADTLASVLWNVQQDSAAPIDIHECGGDARARAVAEGVPVVLCGGPGSARGVYKRPASMMPGAFGSGIDMTSAFDILLLGLGLLVLLVFVLQRVLQALCGFGIALEAVDYPRVYLRPLWTGNARLWTLPESTGIQTLNRKSLLVNAPWSIIPMLHKLCHDGSRAGVPRIVTSLDLSGLAAMEGSALPRLNVTKGQIILVSGLDLVIADPLRRLMALATLEKLVQAIDDFPDDLRHAPYLLFLAPSAPMDRILDAYEREKTASPTMDIKRENLRWARVFEDFATFQFRPIELTLGAAPRPLPGITDRDELEAMDTVFEELRWLSPRIVNGCINDEVQIDGPGGKGYLLDMALMPLRDDPAGEVAVEAALAADPDIPEDRLALIRAAARNPWPTLYEHKIMDWARARRFGGRQAALTYVRGQFIEHYQRLWSSSTVAERLVLHHLAFGRFVNIRTSLGFAPLVRRGLVVLDPEPRVMNESFAMFVRQAEKLDRIKEWQGDLPSSAWVKSRLPIFVLLGIAIAGLATLAMLAGQEVTALLPVLAAGAPALIAMVQRLFRPSS